MNILRSASYRKIVWLLPIALLAHELEEWNIKAWYELNFINPPEVPDEALRAILLLVSLAGFVVTGIASQFSNEKIVAYITLTFFILVSFANALQHVYWQLAWGGYASGVIASLFLVIPLTLWVSIVAASRGLISHFYLGSLYLLSLVNVVVTANGGNVVPPSMQALHKFGLAVATVFGFGA